MSALNLSFSSTDRLAFGLSFAKLSLPSFQKGTNTCVAMLPAMRSGRSLKNTVTGLTPFSTSLPFA
jgi:hypothetical protein